MPEPTLTQSPARQPADPDAGAERRAAVRYHYRVRAATRYVLRPFYRSDYGLLQDLSATGAGLVLDCAPAPGAVLLLQLPGSRPGEPHTRLARVANVRPRPNGGFLVGCEFTPALGDDELAALRRHLGPEA
jgi:hypothetical protein